MCGRFRRWWTTAILFAGANRDCLDVKCCQDPVDGTTPEATGGSCSLHGWLNQEFLRTALSTDERARPAETRLNADSYDLSYVIDGANGKAFFANR